MGRRAALALAVVALVASGCGGSGDDDAEGQIRLEPIGAEFETDLVSDLDPRAVGGALAIALPDVPPLGAAAGGAIEVAGDRPGLYGGSRDIATCDVEQMIDFLTDPANEAEAQAWADVQGIDVDEIAEFIDDLTPVRLRFDTRVTNHGFDGERATAIQSVLQAGTAVLVDDRGIPRAKCACGNPLLPPAGGGDVANESAAWDGFDPAQIVAVEPGGRLDELVLVDVDDGVLFGRPVGTDGEADRVLPLDASLCEVFAESPTCTGREATPDIAMPDVAGSDEDAVRRLLRDLGFVGDISVVVAPADAPEGVVTSSEPPPGRDIPAKSPIVLFVSAGPEASTSTVSTVITTTTSTSTPGRATTTTIERGTTTTSSTSTSSTTSSTSSTSSTTTTTQGVVVPNVVGQDEAKATDTLQAAGFEVVSIDNTDPSNFQDGQVKDQDPAGGTTAPEGSVVTIFVHRVVIS